MDWIQFPFEVDALLLRGPDAPTVRQRWLFTDQPFPPPGTVNVFTNRIWDEDQVSELTVGQLPVVNANFKQDARWQLPVWLKPGHQCHAEWFATGEPFPNDLPPTQYSPEWIPTCCGSPPDPTEGGMEIGGEVGDYFRPPDATSGGMMIGGQCGDAYSPPDPAEGGMEIGGECGDTFAPPDPTEGGMEIGGEAGDVYEDDSGSWVRDTCGPYVFTATFTGNHLLRLYGGGGAGDNATGGGGMGVSGGGGGGGAEANSVLALVAGTDYEVGVGCGGHGPGEDGEATYFKIGVTVVVQANGGQGATGGAGGVGGDAATSLGDQRWDGGSGADGGPSVGGGGGGSSACYSPTGVPPGDGGDGAGQLGGTPPLLDGGAGGDGGDPPDGGAPGHHPGGGGGGAGSDATADAGQGFDGLISIIWPAP